METAVIYFLLSVLYYPLCLLGVRGFTKFLIFNKSSMSPKVEPLDLLEVKYKHSRKPGLVYIIDKGTDHKVFAPWFRWMKNKNNILSVGEYLNLILPGMLFLGPWLAFGTIVLNEVALIMLAVTTSISVFLTKNTVRVIDESFHLDLIKSIKHKNYKRAEKLLKLPEIQQNIHYKNDEIIKEIFKSNSHKTVGALMDCTEENSDYEDILKGMLKKACKTPNKEKIIEELCGGFDSYLSEKGPNILLDALKNYDHNIIRLLAQQPSAKQFIPEALYQAVKDKNYDSTKALLCELKDCDIIEKAFAQANDEGCEKIANLVRDRLLYLAVNRKLIKNGKTKSPFFKSLLNKFTPKFLKDKITFFEDPVTLEYTHKPTLVEYKRTGVNETQYRLYDMDVLQKIYKDTQLEIKELNYYLQYFNLLIDQQQVLRASELWNKLRVKEGPRKGEWLKDNEIVCPYTRLPIFMDQLKSANNFLSLFAYRSSKVKVDDDEIVEFISKCDLKQGKNLSDQFKKNPSGFFSMLSMFFNIEGETALRVLEKAGIIKHVTAKSQNKDDNPLTPEYWGDIKLKKSYPTFFELFSRPVFTQRYRF